MTLKPSRKSNVDDRVGKYNHAIVGLEQKKTGLEAVIGDLNFKIKELNQNIVKLNSDILKRGERIISLSNISREMEAVTEKSKGNVSFISKEIARKIQISEEIMKDKKREYEKLKDEVLILYVRVKSLSGQAKAIHDQRDDIAREASCLRSEVSSLLDQKNNLNKEISDLKSERVSLDEAYRQYNSKKIKLDRREIDLGIYEERLRKRSEVLGINLKMKLK